VEADIAGVAAGLLFGVANGADRLPRPSPPTVEDLDRVDFVASVNLLTQLPVAPLNFLGKRLSTPPGALEEYARAIMQAHLDHLAAFDAVRCLIAETASEHVGVDGVTIAASDPLRGIAIPPADSTWHWTVAPVGEVSQTFAVRNRVAAVTTMPQCSDNAAKRRGGSP